MVQHGPVSGNTCRGSRGSRSATSRMVPDTYGANCPTFRGAECYPGLNHAERKVSHSAQALGLLGLTRRHLSFTLTEWFDRIPPCHPDAPRPHARRKPRRVAQTIM